MEKVLSEGLRLLNEQGHIKAGDRIILTMGDHTGDEGGTNSLRLVQMGDNGLVEHEPSQDICPIHRD